MKRISILHGAKGSGKTLTAKELSKGKKTVWLNGRENLQPFMFSEVTAETELIVVDDIPCRALLQFVHKFAPGKMTVTRQDQESIVIDTPPVLLVGDSETLSIPETEFYSELLDVELVDRFIPPQLPKYDTVILNVELILELESKRAWVNKIPDSLPEKGRGENFIFIDRFGNIATIGEDFSSAEKCNAFPVRVYLPVRTTKFMNDMNLSPESSK